MEENQSIYKRCRFPKEVISFTVWFYYRLNASLRDTQEILTRRGIDISHETIRLWAYKFGPLYSSALRKHQPRRGDKWHLNELCLRMNGQGSLIGCGGFDQEGYELDVLVQLRRNTKAAIRFFKKLLKGLLLPISLKAIKQQGGKF